jgi:acyl dehydratase
VTGLVGGVDLPAPVSDRWFEDYLPGSVAEYGHVVSSEDDIVAFARQHDRQLIHTDPEWAATGPFGGVIASGVQTITVCMGLYVDHYVSQVAGLASPGLDEVRWPRPVRPGDRLRIRVTVSAARVSRSKPDRGLVHSAVQGLTQDDEVVLTFTAMNLFARRPAH